MGQIAEGAVETSRATAVSAVRTKSSRRSPEQSGSVLCKGNMGITRLEIVVQLTLAYRVAAPSPRENHFLLIIHNF